MIRFIDRLLYRLQCENRAINSQNELVDYLRFNGSWLEELQQIAKEKIDLAITRIFNIVLENL